MSEAIKISIILLFFSVCLMEWGAILYYREQANACHDQFMQLEQQADEEARKYAEASDQAAAQLEAMQKQVNDVMNAKIPKKCSDAIRWAIVEAKGFHATA